MINNNTTFETRHLPPDLRELVDTIISGVITLASRLNSNSDSNSLGGTSLFMRGTTVEFVLRPIK